MPVIPLLALQLGFSVPQAAALTTIFGIASFLGPIPAGRLISRVGARPALVTTGSLLVVANLVAFTVISHGLEAGAGLAHQLTLVGLLTMMAASAQVWMLGRQSYLGTALPPAMRARGMTMFGGVIRIGQVAGPLLGALVLALGHDTGVFVLYAVTAYSTNTPVSWPSASTSAPSNGPATWPIRITPPNMVMPRALMAGGSAVPRYDCRPSIHTWALAAIMVSSPTRVSWWARPAPASSPCEITVNATRLATTSRLPVVTRAGRAPTREISRPAGMGPRKEAIPKIVVSAAACGTENPSCSASSGITGISAAWPVNSSSEGMYTEGARDRMTCEVVRGDRSAGGGADAVTGRV